MKSTVETPRERRERLYAASRVYSIDEDWCTPVEYLPYIDALLGDIDLDPCTTEKYNKEFIRAKTIYTIKEDGLNIQDPWVGVTYLFAPTYGKCSWNKVRGTWRWGFKGGPTSMPPTKAWFKRLEREWKLRNVSEALMFSTNAECLRSCESIWDYPVCIPKERPMLIHGRHLTKVKRPFTWGYFVYLPKLEYGFDQVLKFKEIFSHLGKVIC